jgi:glycine cleavage system H protein
MSDTKAESKVPKEGEFQKGHLWFSRRGAVLTIGLTSRAVDALGDIEEIILPEEGDHFDAGDDIVTIEGSRTSVEVSLPSKGVVMTVNPSASDPIAIAEDPLEEGWLIRYQVDDLESLNEIDE